MELIHPQRFLRAVYNGNTKYTRSVRYATKKYIFTGTVGQRITDKCNCYLMGKYLHEPGLSWYFQNLTVVSILSRIGLLVSKLLKEVTPRS